MNLLFAFMLSACSGSTDPAQYLLEGERLLVLRQWEPAAAAFQKAVQTGELSPPGEAMAYWNMFFAYDHTKNTDKTADALIGFLGVGSDFIWRLESLPAAHPGNLWAKTFRVQEKLAFADVALQAIWARVNKTACRSELFACTCPDKRLLGLYVTHIPFCSTTYSVTEKANLLEVNVPCNDGQETYYFIFK
jgi:hypothetical protein